MIKLFERFNILALLLALTVAVGCGGGSEEGTSGSGDGNTSTGGGSDDDAVVKIDGSSTVAPISQAMAEDIIGDKGIKVTVATSGTGGGFKKFMKGETDINDASRPIKDKEAAACKEAGIEFIELKVAIDGLTVVVNAENDWCSCMSVEQLKKLWEPGSTIKKWNELDPSWPDEEIKLFGPDTESGTFDYFTEVIIDPKEGEEKIRSDYTPAVQDTVLVNGVSGDKFALGYFGYAYYVENKDKLKALGIKPADGECVTPTDESIEGGMYTPLSRPLFIYVNKASLSKTNVKAFVEYYLNEGQALVSEVGYVKLSSAQLDESKKALSDAVGGAEEASE